MPTSLHSILWAMEPGTLETVDQVLTAHFEGLRLDLEAIEASIGRPMNNEHKEYAIDNGVAVIPVYGVIGKRMNMFTRISGGVSTEKLQADMQAALDDRAVSAIVLDIDSPGGSVDGTKELADWIHSVRGQKPMYGYANGSMMSGAVWIGTALDRVYGYGTTMVGSISVAMTHFDRSARDEQAGVKRTFITSGRYKRIANDAEPLNEEASGYLQQQVDGIHALFVEDVARNLGMEAADVAAFSEGKVYLTAEAIELGLLHGEKTLAATINAAREAAAHTPGGRMNAQEIQEQYPEAAAVLVEQGRSEAAEQITTAVTAEQERVTGLVTLVVGEDAGEKVAALAASGITCEQAKSLKAAGLTTDQASSSSEQQSRQEILDAIEDSDPDNPGADGKGQGPTDFVAAVEQYMEANPGSSKIQAMKAVQKQHPDLHRKLLSGTK